MRSDSSDAPRNAFAEQLARLHSLTSLKWTRYDADVLPAWVADMDLEPAPVSVEAVRALVDRGDFGYNLTAVGALGEAFADWQEASHGWRPASERVRVLCDVMQGVDLALWLHTAPGDGVVVFTPVYPPFLHSVDASGRRLIECPLEDGSWRLDPDRLSAVIDGNTRAILLCNPHNPTGRVFTRAELSAIADVAEKHDLLIISDEIWADLTHPGARHIPMALLGEETAARTVTLNSANKSFNLAGLRCAVGHFGHDGLDRAVNELPSHMLGAVGSLAAEATRAAWTQGTPWLRETKAHLTAQRDHLAARIGAEAPNVRFSVPEATYLAWLDFRDANVGDDPAKELLTSARVALSPGLDFGERGAGFARLNFATTREILDEIIDRIVARVNGTGG